jgi:hypothetical protein
MAPDAHAIALALPFLLIGLPALIGATELLHGEEPPGALIGPWDGRLTVNSALIYAFAFNVIFLIQELFLVIPKALTPALRPTLFHNNHDWTGHHPLEKLFQGTGALATVITALICCLWLTKRPPRSQALYLFALWMTFHGFMEALPQVVVGAILPTNDVGMAMDFFRMSQVEKDLAAILAIAAIGVACLWLAPRFLVLSAGPAPPTGRRAKSRTIFRAATLPAVLGVLLILPFRVPGAFDQVVLVPVAVAIIGMVWIQSNAWRARPHATTVPLRQSPVWPALIALAAQLTVFQLVLRPGIRFY